MALNWPWALLALLVFPALLAYRWWTRRRRRRDAVRLSSVAVVRAALPGRSLWRRRIPLWLFAAGLVVLATGAARPQAVVAVPSSSTTILLAMDVSASMCSTDVAPNRLTAAQKAAKQFIQDQPDDTRIGLVAFSGIAGVQVEPTTDKTKLASAIDQLRTSRGTAIGLGILTSLDAISEVNPNVPATGVDLEPTEGDPLAQATAEYQPDIIVVLTDGASTQGVDPVTAAEQAAARHIRVYTIGFGTTTPAPSVCTADQISGNPFGGGGGGGFGGRGGGGGFGGRGALQIDEDTLQKVADATGGKYFQAQDAEELGKVLKDLPNTVTVQHRKMEVTVWFALAGALLVLAAVGLAQWWNRTALPMVRRP